jgi:diguanylate cyclase
VHRRGVLRAGAPIAAWIVLAFHGFVWPHVGWYRTLASDDPHRVERTNLVVDSAMGGVFVALMQFALLPSVLIVAMLSMDKIGWGWRFLGRACGAMAATGTATILTRASLRPDTSMSMIVASIPLMVADNRKLKRTRILGGPLT